VAPALLIYFLEFTTAGRFGWIVCFLYAAAAALRLARFNVLAHGKPTPGWFVGLPSPAAGTTLATYYAFSQTELYRRSLAYLDLSHQGLVYLLLLVAVLMYSKVMYPRAWPVNTRTLGGILGLLLVIVMLAGMILIPSTFIFPFCLAYLTFGVVRHLVLIFIDRGSPE